MRFRDRVRDLSSMETIRSAKHRPPGRPDLRWKAQPNEGRHSMLESVVLHWVEFDATMAARLVAIDGDGVAAVDQLLHGVVGGACSSAAGRRLGG